MQNMTRFLIKRILWLIPVLLGVYVLVFSVLYLCPGDPATFVLGTDATQEELDVFRHEYGLDQTYIVRLVNSMKATFLDFDFGKSYITGGSVGDQLKVRLPYTLLISYIGIALAVLIGIPLGIIAATNQNTWKDSLAILVSLFATSMPSFWFALILVMYFGLKLRILPTIGVESWKGYIIPCVATAIGGAAGIARQTRSSMLEVIRQDYIVTARAKGQKEFKVIGYHGLKNALIPVITIVGSNMAALVGNSLICENIFSIPGIGAYLISGVNRRDFPVVLGCVVVLCLIFSLTMLVLDIIYAVVDPRLRSIH